MHALLRFSIAALVAVLAGCAGLEGPSVPGGVRPMTADEGRALIRRALPGNVHEADG